MDPNKPEQPLTQERRDEMITSVHSRISDLCVRR